MKMSEWVDADHPNPGERARQYKCQRDQCLDWLEGLCERGQVLHGACEDARMFLDQFRVKDEVPEVFRGPHNGQLVLVKINEIIAYLEKQKHDRNI
jgi:hypothetical protein